MDRTERFYKIEQLLISRRVVSSATFLEELGISLATLKRDLEYLRDRMNMPIEWDREAQGYRFSVEPPDGPTYSLPGMWFNASEVHALLMMQQLLANLGPGMLSAHVVPLQTRLKALLGSGDYTPEDVDMRFHLAHVAKRVLPLKCFETIATATLSRKQLNIYHLNRQTGVEQNRVISPQQLLFYRDNWYIDAWCHLRKDIRSFAIDAIRVADLLETPAVEVESEKLKAHFEKGYGIFSGKKVSWVKLRFSPERARWIASENWHPEQRSVFDAEGYYLLEIPYTDDRELLMDILKYGADVEVLSPKPLRARVQALLEASLSKYSK
jgi:predicted DNA-binding transcriptional regulator YafY